MCSTYNILLFVRFFMRLSLKTSKSLFLSCPLFLSKILFIILNNFRSHWVVLNIWIVIWIVSDLFQCLFFNSFLEVVFFITLWLQMPHLLLINWDFILYLFYSLLHLILFIFYENLLLLLLSFKTFTWLKHLLILTIIIVSFRFSFLLFEPTRLFFGPKWVKTTHKCFPRYCTL